MYISLAKFQLVICDRKGVHQSGFLIILAGSIVLMVFLGQFAVPLGSVLIIRYVILCNFFANSMALFKFKKGKWVHLGWVKYIGVNS